MTFKRPDYTTPAAQFILEFIQESAPQWVTRKQIAEKLGRKQIQPYDLAMLDYLVSADLIEVRSGARGRFGRKWEYRLKG